MPILSRCCLSVETCGPVYDGIRSGLYIFTMQKSYTLSQCYFIVETWTYIATGKQPEIASFACFTMQKPYTLSQCYFIVKTWAYILRPVNSAKLHLSHGVQCLMAWPLIMRISNLLRNAACLTHLGLSQGYLKFLIAYPKPSI